ncbi:MAG: hypothetical protein ACOCQA_03470 [bacterium]
MSCALTLEQNGIQSIIYEKRSQIGGRFVNCEILLPVLTKPLTNLLQHFAPKYNLFLQLQHKICKLIIHSNNEKTQVTGQLGFTNLKGRVQNSFENSWPSK